MLENVVVEGFTFGKITDFEAELCQEGDAFVVAPDNSRAGLLWEVANEVSVSQISPLDADRWGVWAVSFPHQMNSHENVRRNLQLILPSLKREVERVAREVSKIIITSMRLRMDQSDFDEKGFAIIPNVLGDQDIAKLAQSLVGTRLPRSKAGVRHALKHSMVAETAQDARILDIARQVLAFGTLPFRATLFDKAPESNWLVVWHQDTALPLREKHETAGWGPWSVKDGVTYAHAPAKALEQVLALRVHLDDSVTENGPLRVLPGTHKMGVLSDEEIHELTAKVTSVECLVPRGGILAMRPLIVHASSKSRSEKPRRVLHIEYAASRVIADGFELAVA